MVKVGIIGFGQIGMTHATIVSALQYGQLKAICDKESHLLRLVKKIVPDMNFYSDYDSMIKHEDLDAIFVCTPVQSHSKIVADLVKKDSQISLFVEKPLGRNFEEAQGMVEVARKSSGINMVGFQKRFAGVFRKAKEYMERRAIGEPGFFRSHLYSPDVLRPTAGWRSNKETGGATLEFSPHLLDLLIWYFGEPDSVVSFEKSLFSSQVEDFVHATVEYRNGLRGYVDVSWSMRNFRPPEMLIEVHGENGTISANQDRLDLHIDEDVSGVIPAGAHRYSSAFLTPAIPFLLTNPEYTLEDEHFLNSVGRHQQPEQGFEAGARVNRFVSLIHQAADREKS